MRDTVPARRLKRLTRSSLWFARSSYRRAYAKKLGVKALPQIPTTRSYSGREGWKKCEVSPSPTWLGAKIISCQSPISHLSPLKVGSKVIYKSADPTYRIETLTYIITDLNGSGSRRLPICLSTFVVRMYLNNKWVSLELSSHLFIHLKELASDLGIRRYIFQ